MTIAGADMLALEAAVDAARELKKHFVAGSAKMMGMHDPELPDEQVSEDEAGAALVALFKTLTRLDGPLPHEQPVIADLERELTERASEP